MPVKKTPGSDNFSVWAQGKVDSMRDAVLLMLEDVGNVCIGAMRGNDRTRYKDRTNNLRSSTGYIVVDGGTVVETSGFKPEGNGKDGDGAVGSEKGTSYAESLSKGVHDGEMALVLVAGMNYAAYVEAKGLDVLNSAKLLAKKEVKEELDYLMKNGTRKGNANRPKY